jgi:hypothetical protein
MEASGRIVIGALSKHTGTNIETIRYYERVGLLPAPARSSGGLPAVRPKITSSGFTSSGPRRRASS